MANAWDNLLAGFSEIFSSPLKDPSIWWLLAPIILFWFVIEIYFGRHKKEKLGWNTALGNGLSMFWIVVISLKVLFEGQFGLHNLGKLVFVIFIALYSTFIIFVSFTHKIKENLFFLVASPTAVYYLSGIAILWIYNLLAMSIWVITDLIIIYMAILVFEAILKKAIPPAAEAEHTEMQLGRMQ